MEEKRPKGQALPTEEPGMRTSPPDRLVTVISTMWHRKCPTEQWTEQSPGIDPHTQESGHDSHTAARRTAEVHSNAHRKNGKRTHGSLHTQTTLLMNYGLKWDLFKKVCFSKDKPPEGSSAY